MAAEQDVGGIALGLTLETSGWSSGIARAKAELEGLKRSAAGLEIGVGVATRGGARSATVGGGPAVVAGMPSGGVGAASPVISPKFQVSAQSVRQLRVDINAQLRALGVSGEAVAVPIKLGRVPYATMRAEIAQGIGEVPIRVKPDAGSLTAFANVLSAMTGATPGRSRQAITAAAASRGIPARAQGGPASPNRPHLVGENGPEIHWPTSSGTYIAPRRAIGGGVVSAPRLRPSGGVDVDEYARWAIERDRRMGGLGRIKITPNEPSMAGHSMVVHRALRREGMTDPARLKMHREFYDLERLNIEREAKRIGVTGQQLTHVAAAVSSSQPWEKNVEEALRAIRAVQTGKRGGFASAEQLQQVSAILAGQQVTGVKRLPFAEAFYNPNTFPIDRWMGRITTLGMKSKTDPTGSRMDLMRALANNDWTTTDVPSPSIRRASVFGIEQMAKEWGIDPREAQAEPWGVVRDLSKESRRHFMASGPRKGQPRARGGGVRPFCSTCGTNIRDPRTHQSTAKHIANARGTSSSKWLSQQPPWAYGYRNQDAQYDPPGYEPNTDWWDKRARGGPAFKPVKSDAFYSAVARATQVTRPSGRRVGETVHLYGEDEYAGMRTFLSADGSAGYAIKPDGDLVSVFNVGGPGGGKKALRSAIQRGATKLDAFDEIAPTFAIGKTDPRDTQKNLPRFYERFGFREVGRDPWDPQYAPEGWQGGTPDVVYMERQRRAAQRYRGGPALKDVFPGGVNLAAFDRPRRLAIGKELYRLGRKFPYTASQFEGIRGVSDYQMNRLAEEEDSSLRGQLAPKEIAGLLQDPTRLFGNLKSARPKMFLNAEVSDADIEPLGTLSKTMAEVAIHEFGHGVDDVHRLLTKKGTRSKMREVGMPSLYSIASPAEHLAELFSERYMRRPGQLAGWKNADLFRPVEGREQEMYLEDRIAFGGRRAAGGYAERRLRGPQPPPGEPSKHGIYRVDPRLLVPHMVIPDLLDWENPQYLDKLRSSLLTEGMKYPVTMLETRHGSGKLGNWLSDGNHRVALTAQMPHLFPWIPAEFMSKKGPVMPEDMGIPRYESEEEQVLRQFRKRAAGGWAKGDFFQQAGSKAFGMWKGRPVDRDAVIAWETQLREGPVGNITMADILGASGSPWKGAGVGNRGPDRNRAEGGDVGKYIIGEIGRELFVPKRMEGIIPPDVAAQIPGTEELLANLMMGRARMSGGGVKEIGGKGSQPWNAPEDGWIIPNRLMHRIARSKGGGVHQHGNIWHNNRGQFASAAEVGAEQRRRANNEEQLRRRDEAVQQRSAGARQSAGVQSSVGIANASYAAAFEGQGQTGSGIDRGLAEANISAASVRGLTGRSSLGGLFGFGLGGGRARRAARIEATAISSEYKSLGKQLGAGGRDTLEVAEERLANTRAELEGFTKQLETLNTTTKTGKKDFRDLTHAIETSKRTVGLEAETVRHAADLRIREQDALARASGGAAQNFAAVTAAGFAFNVGMQAVSVASGLAVKALEPVVDRLSGFTAVSQQVSKALAEGLPQAGTLGTLFGQKGVQAGISGRSAGVFEDILGGGVLAKAGATKAASISELIRAAFGSAATSGLVGGFGGVGGGGLFAEQLGGGKGLLEQIAQDVSVTRAGPEGPTSETDAKLFAGIGAAGRQLRNELRSNLGQAGTSILGPAENVLQEVTAITPEQRKAQLESLGVYNEATTRASAATGELGATLVEDAAAAAKVAEATKNSTNEAERFANQMASVGVVFKDTSGNVLTTRRELEKATGVIARGLSIPDQAAFAKSQAQGLAAGRSAAAARGELERNVLIPGQLGQQITANPFTAATSGLAEGFKPTLVSLTRIQSLQNEITRDAQAGVEAQAQLVDQQLGAASGAEFRGYMADVGAYGQQIAGLNEQLANRQAQLGLHQYNFQLRVLNRNIRDARGLAGMAGGSRLGGIQREQYDLGRESQRLSLESQRLANEMSQRQINFQVAVAGFQAPGITGQERAARMEEARIEAEFAQRQLDIQKQQTGIGGQQFGLEGQAFALQTQIAVEDLEAQRGILVESHQLEQEQIAVQKQINALTVRQAQVQAKAQSLFAEATGSFDQQLGAASQYVAQFGGTMAAALVAVRRAIDILAGRSTPRSSGSGTSRNTDRNEGANGLLGFTGGETTFVAGEVAGEAVAILKNPKIGTLGAPGGGGGGSTINISISGNNISSEMDLGQIAREVADAVEDRLSRKASLLGSNAE